MAKESGKQRSIRIPLQYYAERDGIQRKKLTFTWAALAIVVAWWATGFLSTEGRERHSRGPLAAVHATWDHQCEACHEPFVPIGGDGWLASLAGEDWQWRSDAKCESCHRGPVHSKKEAVTPSCVSCHRDHLGRDASLVRLADSDCVSCHADLKASLAENESTDFEDVTSFADDHPEFRYPKEDPGHLKFNHKFHMTPGFGQSFGETIDPAYRDRFRFIDGQVQLECEDCHQLDSGDFALEGNTIQGLHATRDSGSDMIPITYENQCKACHPILFTDRDKNDAKVVIPHGLQPPDVALTIRGYFTANLTRNAPDLKRMVAEFENRVEDALVEVFDKAHCGACHKFENPGEFGVPARITPPVVPDVWFRHARFDHAAHRGVACDDCHPGARPTEAEMASPDTDFVDWSESAEADAEVLMKGAGIDSCRKCHEPDGARDDCTGCHRYHNRDHPVKGLGARERDGRVTFPSFEAFQGAETPKPRED